MLAGVLAMAEDVTPTRRSRTDAIALKNLNWLVRYAKHCGVFMDTNEPVESILRKKFTSAAWRVLCRSPKECFVPILRNRELSLESLALYCARLADHGYQQAPQGLLLAYFINQHRLYCSTGCRIPEGDDFAFMRIAGRETGVTFAQLALVENWIIQTHFVLSRNICWASLVRRAAQFRARERVSLAAHKSQDWHFFCAGMDWQGYRIDPITNVEDLWVEGLCMGSCVYRLRHECRAIKPSRFFSVRRFGKRLATLELVWQSPHLSFKGMDRVWGRWVLQDLRLSFNRLPYAQLMASMVHFASHYNFLSKRPRRLPRDHAQDLEHRLMWVFDRGYSLTDPLEATQPDLLVA
jgi:hypothetical protein